MILDLYKTGMQYSEALLKVALVRRQKRGKESLTRMDERMGITKKKRPDGFLVWIHAASVGEAQSALILLQTILTQYKDCRVLVTTGTLTSARLMEKHLPEGAFHQFYPLDHPQWVSRFLDHWSPDLALWMESELWPNMLGAMKARGIQTILINARMSEKSFRSWSFLSSAAREILESFSTILCQTELDAAHYRQLGDDKNSSHIHVSDNLKYSAAPLPYDAHDLDALRNAIGVRPCWVYASTHEGEEKLAARVHRQLAVSMPEILTIIVPRHPARGEVINNVLSNMQVQTMLRGTEHSLPGENTEIYIANTLGELGLFYRLAPIACIGRSFSKDGGGGHNPIEPAQLGCVVLHGPQIQNLEEIYTQMNSNGAAHCVQTHDDLVTALRSILNDREQLNIYKSKALDFCSLKSEVLNTVMGFVAPYIDEECLRRKTSS